MSAISPAILILETYAFKTKEVIVFINVISMSYTTENLAKSHN